MPRAMHKFLFIVTTTIKSVVFFFLQISLYQGQQWRCKMENSQALYFLNNFGIFHFTGLSQFKCCRKVAGAFGHAILKIWSTLHRSTHSIDIRMWKFPTNKSKAVAMLFPFNELKLILWDEKSRHVCLILVDLL